jgi:dihydroflavonol-4-reductase
MTGPSCLEPGATVLVTGAGGFVGGHVARTLAIEGYHVRALSRRPVQPEPDDPEIEWQLGDLTNPSDREDAIRGVRGVIHVAGRVTLNVDRSGMSRRVNVEATHSLLDLAEAEGVESFVYTSTLWAVAAGTKAAPANEQSEWNLAPLKSPYTETKREAERLVLDRNGPGLRTSVICPGLVVGPRDTGPTSTQVFLTMARTPVAMLPKGGIPLIDVRVLAQAHQCALERGRPGTRYAVVGTYLSYPEMARIVFQLTGRPRLVIPMPDILERPSRLTARYLAHAAGGRLGEYSEALIGGGFLQLHVSGARADREFELHHPDPMTSIYDALEDHRRSGRARWLGPLRAPSGLERQELPTPKEPVGRS